MLVRLQCNVYCKTVYLQKSSNLPKVTLWPRRTLICKSKGGREGACNHKKVDFLNTNMKSCQSVWSVTTHMLFVDSITNLTMSEAHWRTFSGVSIDGWWDRCGHGSPCHRWHQRVGGVMMEFSARAFFALRISLAALDRWTSEWRAPVNHVSPGWSVKCDVFPCGDVDVEVLEVSFQGVFEVLALSSYLPWLLSFGRRDRPSVSVPFASWWWRWGAVPSPVLRCPGSCPASGC